MGLRQPGWRAAGCMTLRGCDVGLRGLGGRVQHLAPRAARGARAGLVYTKRLLRSGLSERLSERRISSSWRSASKVMACGELISSSISRCKQGCVAAERRRVSRGRAVGQCAGGASKRSARWLGERPAPHAAPRSFLVSTAAAA